MVESPLKCLIFGRLINLMRETENHWLIGTGGLGSLTYVKKQKCKTQRKTKFLASRGGKTPSLRFLLHHFSPQKLSLKPASTEVF